MPLSLHHDDTGDNGLTASPLPSSVKLALADKRLVSNALSSFGLAQVAEHLFAFDTFSPLQFEMIEPIMERVDDNIFAGVPPGAGKTTLA